MTTTAITPCTGCGLTPKTASRLPTGWKRRGEAVYCAICWRKQYVLRAITFRIAEPESGWKALDEALRVAWAQYTGLTNWALCELYSRDAKPTEPGQRITPMARIYLYPEARARAGKRGHSHGGERDYWYF